jgi:hypothetical protein
MSIAILMSDSKKNHIAKEQTIFRDFVATLKIDMDSMESREPPEPDIVCQIVGCGKVGFELTELIDQNFKKREVLMYRTKCHLTNAPREHLSKSESSEFCRKYKNAFLLFRYRDGSSLQKRKLTTKSALQALLSLPDNYKGTLTGREFLSIPTKSALNEIRVCRGDFFKGPILDTDSSGLLGDPVEATFHKKLSKRYEVKYPIELLTYIETDLLRPQDALIVELQKLEEKFLASQFKKVWVFDRRTRSIRYQWPQPTP